ncbi:MAG: GPP34 family phosphoprotein [Pseudomonadota bacterium]
MPLRLTLPEKVLLLVLDEITTWDGAVMPGYLAAGAAIAELTYRGHITPVGEGRTTWFQPTYMQHPRDEMLAYVLDIMTAKSFEKRAGALVSAVANQRPLITGLKNNLLHKGILRRESRQRYLIFWETIFPVDNPVPQEALVKRMTDTIFGNRDIPFELAVMITLARGAGVLPHYFDRRLLRAQRQRLNDIGRGAALDRMANEYEVDALTAAYVASLAFPGAASHMK